MSQLLHPQRPMLSSVETKETAAILKERKVYACASYSKIESAGPPSPPLGFHAPSVLQAEKLAAYCYDPSLQCFSKNEILVHVKDTTGDNTLSDRAYLITGMTIKTTLCGEITLGEILEPMRDSIQQIPEQAGEGPFFSRTRHHVAIKIDKRKTMRSMHDNGHPHPENPWKEVAAIELLGRNGSRHPNIVSLIEALYDDDFLYEVMPYYSGGSLQELVNSKGGGLEESQARNFFRQVLSAIDYIHSRGVCHRDISTQNIMLGEQSPPVRCVLIDFGMCLRVPHSYPDDHQTEDTTDVSAGTMRRMIHSQSHCGKLRFMAPEMYRMEDFDGLTVDLWSAAVVLFVMLSGRHPYEKPDPSDAGFHDLMDPNYYWNPAKVDQRFSWGRSISHGAVDLLHRMFALDPRQRISLEEIARHPWVLSGLEYSGPKVQ